MTQDIARDIARLKREKNALILAHYYQTMDIQSCADIVGDSFELACRAREASEPLIVLCGVSFMAESAKILAPDKTVLLPSLDAGCVMADMIEPEDVRRLKKEHPGAAVVCYVNSSAAVKAECDVCCTSSSAVRIVRAMKEREIIFVPDRNLGDYVSRQVPEKTFFFFDGYCPIHDHVTPEQLQEAKAAHPEALTLAHPECRPELLALADEIGSTAFILKRVLESDKKEFIVATEVGVAERLRVLAPEKQVYLPSTSMFCSNMKKTRITDLLRALETETHVVTLPEEEMAAACRSLDRMIELGNA